MATTLTLQNSINFVTPILKNQPVMVTGLEPALTAGNMILASILGAPFRWRFNRGSNNFAITGAATDYTVAISDFGFIEAAWLKDGSGNIFQLGTRVVMPVDGNSMRPTEVSPLLDDNAGNITFRFDKTPDQSYTAYLNYQKKATLIQSPAGPWGNVPDEFNHIFNWGFLTVLALLTNDSRFPIFEQYFISRLLGAQDGLTAQERNIFLGQWAAFAATLTRDAGMVNAGVAGRGK